MRSSWLRVAAVQGQALHGQASLGAGLPLATGCTTINKMWAPG